MKKYFSLIGLLVFGLVYFAGCGLKPQEKPGWLALSPGSLVLTDQNYFAIVYVSDVSFDDATEKGKNELAAKVYNTVAEYLSRLQMPADDDVRATIRDALSKRIKAIADAMKPYVEVKEKFQERKPKKFYVLSGLASEQIFSQISKVLEGFYDPDYLLQALQESGEIYRVKVETDYDEEITPQLVENGCLIDNGRYYASVIGTANIISQSSLKSLSGPLWTIKGQYTLTIKGKKGDVLGRITGSIGTGTAGSKEEALDKAVGQNSIDLAGFAQYIPSIKSSIEAYLKERISKLLKKSEEPASFDYASAMQLFETGDYQSTTIYLELCSIYSKEFPQTIILYLRAKGKLGSAGIPNL